jgi:hypothetical protein
MLKTIFFPKEKRQQKNEGNYIIRSFTISALT